MLEFNTTDFTNPSTFILLGIPGLEAAHVWISIPFCAMYSIAVLGNFTILFIVKREPSLHEPMYYFLSMLAVTDLVLCTSTMPKILSIFWFNSREIDFSACLTQMYFIHCFSAMESGIFVAMALDRYVAICHPLRHSTILTKPIVARIGLTMVLRGGILALPYPFLARQWPYCRTNIIPQPYCAHIAVVNLACADTRVSSYYGLFMLFCVMGLDVIFIAVTNIIPQPYCAHIAVVNLACADTRVSSYYGLFVLFCVMGLDMFFIAMSYIQILRAIFSLPTKDARLKTFGTCGSHLCAILAFYIPNLFFSLLHRFGQNVPLHFHVLIANVYLLMPPMLNPIIYGVRTKQIWIRLVRIFTHEGV
uniref:G-protein coupled receptors family 1 profile domain-containing protein n=1 Tax=Chelydra serpentina TaxID=8475 RepID=A0A8C3T5E8_CHESE